MNQNLRMQLVSIWIRASTEDQANGESPGHHEERARHYAAAQDREVVESYDLSGVSGKDVLRHPLFPGARKRAGRRLRVSHPNNRACLNCIYTAWAPVPNVSTDAAFRLNQNHFIFASGSEFPRLSGGSGVLDNNAPAATALRPTPKM